MKIKCAAVKTKAGRIFEGKNHAICYQAIKQAGVPRLQSLHGEPGFVTDEGDFVDRYKAAEIAFAAGQTQKLESPLFSEDLTGDWPWKRCTELHVGDTITQEGKEYKITGSGESQKENEMNKNVALFLKPLVWVFYVIVLAALVLAVFTGGYLLENIFWKWNWIVAAITHTILIYLIAVVLCCHSDWPRLR